MTNNSGLDFNIEQFKFIPEKLDGFEEFCKTHETECFGGYTFFKVFSKDVLNRAKNDTPNLRSQDGGLGDLHDKAIYEFHINPCDGKSLYTHICNAFKEFNAVLDAIAKGDISHYLHSYLKLNRAENKKNNKKIFETYQEYIDTEFYNIGLLAFEFFEGQAIGPLIAENYKNSCKQRPKNKNKPVRLPQPEYQNFYNDIAFVSCINDFSLFIPEGKNSPLINNANRAHELLIMQLRVASFHLSIYYYWLFMASNTKEKDKEINELKAQIHKEKVSTFLMAGKVHLSHINNHLSTFYNKSAKANGNNTKEVEKNKNYNNVVKAIEESRANRTDDELYKYLRSNLNKIKNKTYVGLEPRTIKKHLNKYFNK